MFTESLENCETKPAISSLQGQNACDFATKYTILTAYTTGIRDQELTELGLEKIFTLTPHDVRILDDTR